MVSHYSLIGLFLAQLRFLINNINIWFDFNNILFLLDTSDDELIDEAGGSDDIVSRWVVDTDTLNDAHSKSFNSSGGYGHKGIRYQ